MAASGSEPSVAAAAKAVVTHTLAMQHTHIGLDAGYEVWSLVSPNTARQFVIPILGLVVGRLIMQVQAFATLGKLVLFFGAQSFMNIYMGWALRTSVTVPAGTVIRGKMLGVDLTGCPTGFALTAIQQVISFLGFIVYFFAVYHTPYRYMPKKLKDDCQVLCVVIFGCVFALNIALNNFSLGYVSIEVNLIIRSCLPLGTLLVQNLMSAFGLYTMTKCRWKEVALMAIGVLCAVLFTVARIMGSQALAENYGVEADTGSMILGVSMCVGSLICGALNLALAGVLGETKLNVYDTVAYMAVPAAIFLLPITLFWRKKVPGAWSEVLGRDEMTDWEILSEVWVLNKWTVLHLFLSGIFAFLYNVIQFSVVHTLSPTATAFGGNFNKAALIFLTLSLPFLRVHKLPGSPYIEIIWFAVVANIAAFSAYGFLQLQRTQETVDDSKKALNSSTEDAEASDGEAENSEEDAE